METFKQPDIWFKFREFQCNLSKMTDEELSSFEFNHLQVREEWEAAYTTIQRERMERKLMDQGVLDFFSAVAMKPVEYDGCITLERYLDSEVSSV